MTKAGRNDPCPCGSGKKYKRCCLPAQEAAEAEASRAVQAEAEARARERRSEAPDFREGLAAMRAEYEEEQALIEESNAIVALIHDARLDEAEQRARALMIKAPWFPDGLERLGHVYEKRGDGKTAAHHYREAIALVSGQGIEEDDHQVWLRELADRLDPPAAT